MGEARPNRGPKRYRDFNGYLRGLFGCRVQKITVDAGLTCPNRDGTLSDMGCLFCNARGSGTGAFQRGLSVREQLERGKQQLAKRYKAKRFIAYFQSFTNTYAPPEHLRRLYGEALSVTDVAGLSIGTRPDCVDESVLGLLQDLARRHMIWVEYGLQSAHDTTLAIINRGHDVRCFRDAVKRTRHRGILICAHVILGLPGEQKHHMLETARAVARMGLDGIKIHLCYVVKGTGLEALYLEGGYRPLEQDEYVEILCDFLELLPPEMVVQRLTGDPHPEELVAPLWCRDKARILSLLEQTLEKRDSWQGKRFSA